MLILIIIQELQEKLLQLQEDLIIAKVGKEAAQEQEKTLQGDIMLLREQIMQRESIENDLVKEVSYLKYVYLKLQLMIENLYYCIILFA